MDRLRNDVQGETPRRDELRRRGDATAVLAGDIQAVSDRGCVSALVLTRAKWVAVFERSGSSGGVLHAARGIGVPSIYQLLSLGTAASESGRPGAAGWSSEGLPIARAEIRVSGEAWGAIVIGFANDADSVVADESLSTLDWLAEALSVSVERTLQAKRLLGMDRADVAAGQGKPWVRSQQGDGVAQILDRVSDGLIALDLACRVTYVNRAGAEILGRSPERLLGHSIWSEFPEAVGGPVHEALKLAADSLQPQAIEAYFAPWCRWFENRIYPSATGTSILFTDITERRSHDLDLAVSLLAEAQTRSELEIALSRLRAIERMVEPALAYLAPDDLAHELLSRLRSTLDVDFATLLLLDERRQHMVVHAHQGFASEVLPARIVPLDLDLLSVRVVVEGRGEIANGAALPRDVGWQALYRDLDICSVMGAPLLVAGRATGAFTVAVANPKRRFTDEDLGLLQVVADRVAPVIERSVLEAAIRTSHSRLEVLSSRLLVAQEQERRRVAVELHDDLGQALALTKLNLELLRQETATGSGEGRLQRAIEAVDLATTRVRNLALNLRPAVLDDLGLAAALRWYTDRFARESGLAVELTLDVGANLAPDLATTCFRVVQEALTNVAKHAAATRVVVDAASLPHEIVLRVLDDGIGFDPATARRRGHEGYSLGLLGMEERVALVGGRLEVRPRQGGGIEVMAWLPTRVPEGARRCG